jgi:hypothetical protein
MLDVILLATLVALFAALALYKVILLFCYRNDPAKREALISSGQVYPKRLRKFIFDEDAHTSDKKSSPLNSVSK